MSRFPIVITVLVLLASCSPPPKVERLNLPIAPDHQVMNIKPGQPGGIFVETEPGEPKTFNFLLVEDNESAKYSGLFFESLVFWNPITSDIEPALAKSWDVSPDQKTFTFHLREGLCWSDGQPLTADDVLFTFRAIYDPRYPNRNAISLSVDGHPFVLKKVDQLTVQIQTSAIFAPFLINISGTGIVPQHILEPYFQNGTLEKCWTTETAQQSPQSIVVNGAYKILSYHPGERVVLEPNPYYYKTDTLGHRLPYVDFLVKKTVKDMNECMLSFASGQTDSVDVIYPNDVDWVAKAAEKHGCKVVDLGPSTTSGFIWFNLNPGQNKGGKPFVDPVKLKWFQDPRFRQAVSYGIDRLGIVKGVLLGRGAPQWSYVPENNKKWYNPNVKKYPYNPELARKLLSEAGFRLDGNLLKDSAGHPVEFSLYTNHENSLRMNIATVFQENMRDLGISVKLQFIDFNAFTEKIDSSFDYDAGLLGLTGSPDPSGDLSFLLSSGSNHQWNPNQKHPATPWEARIDELMMAELKTLDESVRKRDYDEVQSILSEQCPLIYLVTRNNYVGYRTKWQNIRPTIWDPPFWNPEQLWSME